MSQPKQANNTPQLPGAFPVLPSEQAVCSQCRGTQLYFDATARWDSDCQVFDFDFELYDAFCLDCAATQEVDWIPL